MTRPSILSRKSSMSRRLIVPFTLVALLSLVACKGAETEATVAAPVTVEIGPEGIALAETSVLSSGPLLSGTLVAGRTAQIRAEVPGSVVQVLVDEGTRVTKGASLAQIDDRAITDAFLSARSALAAAQAGRELAARELTRAERLAQAGAIADRDVENAKRGDLLARTAFDDAQARFAAASKQKDAAGVLAPYAGIVSERFVNPGDVVTPGAPLFTVVDPATMRLEAAVPAEQLSSPSLRVHCVLK